MTSSAEGLDVVEAVASSSGRSRLAPISPDAHLGVEVAGHVVGRADVGEDELPDVVVALAPLHQLDDRDPEPFLEDVAAPGADAVAADVGVVDGGAEEGDDRARCGTGTAP
jgi:hypothetical protein